MFSESLFKEMIIGALWSLTIVIGAAGLGSALTRLLKIEETQIWIKACLGLSLFVIISGYLDYLSLANRVNLVIIILTGLIYWVLSCGPKDLYSLVLSNKILSLALILPSVYLVCLHSIAFTFNATWDDSCGYWPVVHQMSVTGQSWAPLSLRRSLSWGGQYPLQLLGMTFNLQLGGFIYDRAVGTWICLLAILSIKNSQSKPILATIIAGVCLLTLPVTTTNSAPAVLAAVLIASLWYVRSKPLLFTIVASSLVLMRTQMIIPCILIGAVGLYELTKQKKIKESLYYILIIATVGFISILPNMLLHLKMFETVFVFINNGTVNKNYITFEGHKTYILENILNLLINHMSVIGAITAGILFKVNRTMWVISLVSLLTMTVLMPEYSNFEWVRYTWPIISSAAAIAFISYWNQTNWKIILIIIIILTATTSNSILLIQNKIQEGVKGEGSWYEGSNAETQLLIPEGKSIAYFGTDTSLLNYNRNKIYNWDSYPAVGNPPKDNNPQAWKSWAKSQGIDYLLIENLELRQHSGKTALEECIDMEGATSRIKHFKRAWAPDRKKSLKTLISLKKTLPYYRIKSWVIVDLRDDNTYELSIPSYQVNELNKEFEERETFEKKFEERVKELRKEGDSIRNRQDTRGKKRDRIRDAIFYQNKTQDSNPNP